MTAPLVVTLSIEDAAQQRFDAERRRLFPAGRTEIGAHITLFHAVPGELDEQVRNDLTELAGAAFMVRVSHVMSLGRGAAYALESPELLARHRTMQRRWHDRLTAQDRQPFRPHITVQNKVSPAEAKATVAALQHGFERYDVRATGFVLWRYEGGPWTELQRFPFAPMSD